MFPSHDLVGPYLVRCDHGCFHTGDHATSIGGWEDQGDEENRTFRNNNRRQIQRLCTNAMINADLLLFWFDSLDAYGTMAELLFLSTAIGMANSIYKEEPGSQMHKHIFVASPSFIDLDEMWLVFALAKGARSIEVPTPKEALEQAISMVSQEIAYSPIEKQFIDKWQAIYGNGITPPRS